ncbi:MAG: glycosyltransferase [Bacteroidetes bacterium]|nr:glycosyltransferase [Bacteroidota bacterium]
MLTYQHASYIRDCLESILAQRTTHAFEVLIGEDGSTDGTREICLEVQQRYPERVKVLLNDRRNVIHIEGSPSGRWNALNLYTQARGRFVALCEGDDRWCDPGKLQLQADALLADRRAGGTFHDTAIITDTGERTGRMFPTSPLTSLPLADLISTLAACHFSSFMYRNHPGFRRIPRWFKRVGVFDMVLFALAAEQGPLIKVPGTLSEYRKHDGGITMVRHNTGSRLHLHRMMLWLRLAHHVKGLPEDRLRAIITEHFGRVCREDDRRTAFIVLRDLFLLAPTPLLMRPYLVLRMLRMALHASTAMPGHNASQRS